MKITITTLFLVASILRTFSQDTIALTPYAGNLKKLNVSIENKQYTFLFDTGGGETLISPEVASSLKKEPYSKALGIRMSGEKIYFQKCDSVIIDFGPIKVLHTTLGVWDMMNVLPKGLPKIDGVISLKSFNNKIVTVDLVNNRLIIETFKSYENKIKNMTLLNSRIANGPDGNELTVFLSTRHAQHIYWFLFDSGNISQFIFSPQTAYEWGLQNDKNSVNKEYDTVVLLGTRYHQVNVVTENIMYEGVFNYAFISKNVYILDLVKNKVWKN